MGGAVRIYISGGAPLGRHLAEWFACVGIRIHEGYGLTETSPVIAVNTPKAHRLGTVGKPLPNVEVRIAPDGEILVRGPSVSGGYWNLPQETREAFKDGWFATGDIGNLDEDGFLSVTDRKKNLIKTSGGKFIAPQPIEARLKLSPWIEEAVVIGDRRKFPAVILVPAFPALEAWARDKGLPTADRQALVEKPATQTLYYGIVDELNQTLPQFEKLKKVLILPQPLSMADGTLTPSMKLRRHALEERYREQISGLYEESEAARE
jgi:long-chain acyl-CoA synthetase